jgi:hypothetical protein
LKSIFIFARKIKGDNHVGGICYNSDNFFRPRDRLIEMTKDPIIQGTETDKGLFLRKGDIHDNENGTIFFSTEE